MWSGKPLVFVDLHGVLGSKLKLDERNGAHAKALWSQLEF